MSPAPGKQPLLQQGVEQQPGLKVNVKEWTMNGRTYPDRRHRQHLPGRRRLRRRGRPPAGGTRPLPEGVRVVDFGIRGLDLAYALLGRLRARPSSWTPSPRGGPPGTLYLIEPDWGPAMRRSRRWCETHGMDPVTVLRLVQSMGGPLARACGWSAASRRRWDGRRAGHGPERAGAGGRGRGRPPG